MTRFDATVRVVNNDPARSAACRATAEPHQRSRFLERQLIPAAQMFGRPLDVGDPLAPLIAVLAEERVPGSSPGRPAASARVASHAVMVALGASSAGVEPSNGHDPASARPAAIS